MEVFAHITIRLVNGDWSSQLLHTTSQMLVFVYPTPHEPLNRHYSNCLQTRLCIPVLLVPSTIGRVTAMSVGCTVEAAQQGLSMNQLM